MKWTNKKNHGVNYNGRYVKPFETVEIDNKNEENEDFENELMKIKGIGKKVVKEILSFAKNRKQLKKVSDKELYARLRDDIAEKIIKKYKEDE